MAKRLLVIQGAPGVGKTTLSRELARDLSVPLVAKDVLKEVLYDSLGHPRSTEETQLMGRAAIQAMYAIAREYVQAGQLVMIEAPLHVTFAPQDIAVFLPLEDVLQVHVFCDALELRRRFIGRIVSGQRHRGHLDEDIDAEAALVRNGPLAGVECLPYDTTRTDDSGYVELLQRIKGCIE